MAEAGHHYSSDSDDVDESLIVPKPEDGHESVRSAYAHKLFVLSKDGQDDPVIEYKDEFGRSRQGRRSEVPRHLLPRQANDENEDECVISTLFLLLHNLMRAVQWYCRW
jgi:hypothetical protein